MTNTQIQQYIGQLQGSITKVEGNLTQEEFEDYCDAVYTCIAYFEKIRGRQNNRARPFTSDEAFKPIKDLDGDAPAHD